MNQSSSSIKILNQNDILIFKNELLELYDPENIRADKYFAWLQMSTYVVTAFSEKSIVGAIRILSDKFMVALFFDLYVHPQYRKQWIWSNLVSKAIDICKQNSIKNIELIADPRDKWLEQFYQSLWFTTSEDNGTYFSFKN